MSNVKKGRGCVYSIQYHIVWCVKYRRKVLTGVVEEKLEEILFNIAEENGFTIEEYNCDQDHVHLLIDCKPQHYIPNFIKALKGVSGRFIFKECPWLKDSLWGGHLWNPSYFVATVSENTQAQVRAYIQSQKEK